MGEKLRLTKDKKEIIQLLAKGKIGLIPTDTIYGICCRVDNERSVRKIFRIKKRDEKKPLLILCDSFKTVQKYTTDIPETVRKNILDKYWPGPLTVILPARKNAVSQVVRADGQTVAVRVPNSSMLRELIKDLGVPIVAPSANLQDEPPYFKINDIDKRIVQGVDFLVEGKCKMKVASTIIDCSGDVCNIVRKGALDIRL